MSPLTHSLLALAALLAAADAQSNCNTVLFGVATSDPINYQPTGIPAGGGHLFMDDECQKQQNRMLVGELVTVCNYDEYGAALLIAEEYPPAFSPVLATCPDGCPYGGYATVVQYCY